MRTVCRHAKRHLALLVMSVAFFSQVYGQQPDRENPEIDKRAVFKKIVSDKNLSYQDMIQKCDSLFAKEIKDAKKNAELRSTNTNSAGKGEINEEIEGEDGDLMNYMRWRRFWATRIDASTGKLHSFAQSKASAAKNLWRDCGERNDGDWKFIGPKNLSTPHLGRVQCISVNPSNTSEIYISDFWGGLWKTTNKGANWTCLTDNDPNLSGLGVQKFVVNYSANPHIIVAAVGYPAEGLFAKIGNRTSDIYLSTDDGQNYSPFAPGLIDWDTDDAVNDMAIHPTQPGNVFVATKFKVIRYNTSTYAADILLDYASFYGGSYNFLKAHFNGFHSITFLPGGTFQPNPMFVSTRGMLDGHRSSATLLRTLDCLSSVPSFTDMTTNLSTTAFSHSTNLVENGTFNVNADGWLLGSGAYTWNHNGGNQNVEINDAASPPQTVYSTCLEKSVAGFFSPNATNYTFSGTFKLPPNTRIKAYLLDYSHQAPWEYNPSCGDINIVPTQLIYNSDNDPNKVFNTIYNSQPVNFNNGGNYYNRLVFQVEYDPGYSGGTITVDNVNLGGTNLYHIATGETVASSNTLYSMVTRWQDNVVYVQKSTDYGVTWTDMGNITDAVSGGVFNQGWANLYENMEVSTINTNTVYHTLQHLKIFQNGNTGTGNIAHNYSYVPGPTHADVRSLQLIKTGASTEEIFTGHDGGLSVYANGTWTCLTCDDGFESSIPYGIGSDVFSGKMAISALDNGVLESDIENNYDVWTHTQGGDGFYLKYAKRYDLKNTYLWTDNGPFVGMHLYDHNGTITGGFASASYLGYLTRPKTTESGEYYADDHVYRLSLSGTTASWVDLSTSLSWTIPAGTAIPAVAGHPLNEDIIAGYAGNEWDHVNGRFFITFDGGTTWNISGSNPFNAMIVDMCIDPQFTSGGQARLWASAGWYGTAGTGRVFISNNGGTSWDDYSTGLPDGPVNTIVYDEQGKFLFAATDIGVFYRDVNVTDPSAWNYGWRCFSKNLPNCIIQDLEINRCANKLYAASHGRGAWETDLPPNWGFSDVSDVGNTMNITAPTVWSQDKYISKNVVIHSGAKLTIRNCTINMARNKNFEVERGATLVIDNATITNTCKCMWGSIIVKGDPNVAQTYNLAGETSNQGFLIMRNNARLEHAYLGILVSESYYDGDDYPVYTSGGDGGLVIAENSSFANCSRSAAFNIYSFNQNSKFENCSFEADQYLRDYVHYTDYSAPQPRRHGQKVFITSWACPGVKVLDCSFNNILSTDYNPDRDLWPMGFGGGGANFTIENSRFTNLSRGILVAGDHGPSSNTRILNNDFIDVWRSITCRQANNVGIEKNRITIGKAIQYEHRTMEEDPTFEFGFDPYGIYYSYGTGYWIFDNVINYVQGASETYGVILNDVNNVPSPFLSLYSLYRNNITADYGVVANQDNRGAQIKCNELNTNKHGIIVTSYEVEGAPPMNGMLSDQGYCFNNQTPAGNTFNQYFGAGGGPCTNEHLSSTSGNPILTPPNSFDYYHHSPNPYVPLCAASPTPIGTISCPVICINNDCCPDPPPYTTHEEDGKNIVSLPVRTNESIVEIEKGLMNLEENISNGNRKELYELINNTSFTSTDVRFKLVNAGPYLSDEVLIKAINRTPAMDYSDLKEVLLTNSALRSSVWNELVQKRPELADDAQLRAAQSTQSARRGIEGAMAELNVEKNRQIMVLADHYGKNGLWKECAELYEKEGAYYTAMSYYLQAKDMARANQMIEKISDKDMQDLSRIIINRIGQNRMADKFNEQERAVLIALAQKPYTRAGDAARLMLGQNYGFIPLELMPVIENTKGNNDDRDFAGIATDGLLKVYPNPANNVINIDVVNGTFVSGTVISVFDMAGRCVSKIVPEPDASIVQLNSASWISGMYLVNMHVPGRKTITERVTISK